MMSDGDVEAFEGDLVDMRGTIKSQSKGNSDDHMLDTVEKGYA